MIHPSRLNSTRLGWHFLLVLFLKPLFSCFNFSFYYHILNINARQFSLDYFKQCVGTVQRCSVCHVYLYVRKHNMLNHQDQVNGTEVNICSFIVSRLRTAVKTTFQLLCYSLLSCCVFACIIFPSSWAKQVWLKTKTLIFFTVTDVPVRTESGDPEPSLRHAGGLPMKHFFSTPIFSLPMCLCNTPVCHYIFVIFASLSQFVIYPLFLCSLICLCVLSPTSQP